MYGDGADDCGGGTIPVGNVDGAGTPLRLNALPESVEAGGFLPMGGSVVIDVVVAGVTGAGAADVAAIGADKGAVTACLGGFASATAGVAAVVGCESIILL